MNPEQHEELRKITAFQLWLGTNYTTLPTDSGEMTKRARLYKEYCTELEKANEIFNLNNK